MTKLRLRKEDNMSRAAEICAQRTILQLESVLRMARRIGREILWFAQKVSCFVLGLRATQATYSLVNEDASQIFTAALPEPFL
jgi:hypothetical protein